MTPVPRLTAFVLAVLLPVVTVAPALGGAGTALRTALAGLALVAVVRSPGRPPAHLVWLVLTWVSLVAAMAVGSRDLGEGIVRAINWLMFVPLVFLPPRVEYGTIALKSLIVTCWIQVVGVAAQMMGLLGGTWGGLLTSGRDYDPAARNYLTRYTGFLFNPNDLGLILAMGVVVALMVASYRPEKAIFALPSAGLFTLGIVLTGSRGGLIALVLGIAVLLVFLPTLHRLLVVSFAAAGGLTMVTTEGETRLVFDSITDIFSGADTSTNVRTTLWADYLQGADNLVIGGAFGATTRATAAQSVPVPSQIATVDNSLLKLLLEGGVISVAVLLALAAAIYLPLIGRRNTRDYYTAGAILALVAMIAFRSLSVDLLDINPWNAIIWLLAGLAVGNHLPALGASRPAPRAAGHPPGLGGGSVQHDVHLPPGTVR